MVRFLFMRVCYFWFCILKKATDRPHLGRKMLAATCGKSSVLHVFAFGGLKRGGSIKV